MNFLTRLSKKYTVQIIILVLVLTSFVAITMFTKTQNNKCMDQKEIDTDPRCLYVYNGNVYEKGTRQKPHKGKQCGMNVDSIIPDLHFIGDVLTKFDNSKVAPLCRSVKNESILNEITPSELTKISKPVVYISLLGVLTSIIVVMFI